jgi:hypothetical protein
MNRWIIAVLVLFAAATTANAALSRTPDSVLPPIIPSYFMTNFTEFTATPSGPPPYVDGVPQPPFKASRGYTWYDWSKKNIIEKRLDYCVNIFPDMDNTFPCTFQNVNGTSYLISEGAPHLPPCCVFGQPWYPAPPDFLRKNVNSTYGGKQPWGPTDAFWFANNDIAPPTGPFWWSFMGPELRETQLYSSFGFPGMNGWVQQNFFDVKVEEPPAAIWDLPSQCLPVDKLPNCGFFGAQLPTVSMGAVRL